MGIVLPAISLASREATTLGRAVAIAASTALVTNVCIMVAVVAPDPDGVVVAIPAATVVTVAVVGSVMTFSWICQRKETVIEHSMHRCTMQLLTNAHMCYPHVPNAWSCACVAKPHPLPLNQLACC